MDPAALEAALLIRYDPGAGIGWHRDRPQYGEVARPLARRAVRHAPAPPHGGRASSGASSSCPPRSLYRLSGEVRWDWEHSIAPMEETRRSITFRTLR